MLAIILLFSVGLCFVGLQAQERKLVSGEIVNKSTRKPFGKNDLVIRIYGFDTETLAEDALAVMKENEYAPLPHSYAIAPPDETGFFSAVLPPYGAIIVKAGISEPILVKINDRRNLYIPVDVGELLEAVVKTETFSGIRPIPEAAEINGNIFVAFCTIQLPDNLGRSNARLIMQPVFVDADNKDTVAFLRPWIYDGKQYKLTQERRMGYDRANDPLTKYVRVEELTENELSIPWTDTVYLNNPNGHYYIKGKMLIEDYNMVYHVQDSLPLASVRARRPMRFLDYQMDFKNLNADDYYVHPRPERMGGKGEMMLTFLVNQAVFDESNPNNAISMNNLRESLLKIVNGENTRLIEFHIVGVASPEGRYDSNVSLAGRRTRYAFEQIVSSLPANVRRRVYMSDKSVVAPWSDVIPLLNEQGRVKEANAVQEIVESVEGHDKQGAQIMKLAGYTSVIKPLLAKLRTVKYTYVYEEDRALTPAEILNRYNTNNDYKSGKKHFALYEYWHLFNMVKDSAQLKALYKRAYDESAEDNAQPWILAANKLAVTYLQENKPDTSILGSFIDMKYKCNMEINRADGSKVKVNPAPVVANQLCMYLMMDNFTKASVLAEMLPDTDEYKLFKAITMCLGGYYKGGAGMQEREQRAEWYEMVKESGPRNRVVMLLAMNSKSHTFMAEEAIKQLSDDDALTWYFKAVVSSRKCKYNVADLNYMELDLEEEKLYNCLKNCFDRDSSFIDIVRMDGDIDEDELTLFFENFPQYNK